MSAPPASDREPLRSMWHHLTADKQPACPNPADFLGRVHEMLAPQTDSGLQLPRLKPLKVLPAAGGAAKAGAAGSAVWLGSPSTPELDQALQHHLSAEFERQARAIKDTALGAATAKALAQKPDAEAPDVDGMDASGGTQTGSSPGSSRKRGSDSLLAAAPDAADAGLGEQTAGSNSAPKRNRSSTPVQPPLSAAALPAPCPPDMCPQPRPPSQPQLMQQGRLTPLLGSLALESVPGPAAMAGTGAPAAAAWTAPPPRAAVPSPSPTPDMDAFLQLMMQKRVLQQQLSHLQQQIAGSNQARSAMVYAPLPPAAALAAAEQAQQAQHYLERTSNEQHRERAAALAASLALAKQQQQKQHQLLQRALVEQLQQQQRQEMRLYQPKPHVGASTVPPQPAPPPPAPAAMPAWQQLKLDCQQQLRQLAAEEQIEDEEEERAELRSSASSSSPVQQLSQRTIRAERALNAVATLVLCPLSRRVMTDPVVAADGHTYERRNIQACFQRSSLSPITGKAMDSTDLKPNHIISMLLVHLVNAGQLSGTCAAQGPRR